MSNLQRHPIIRGIYDASLAVEDCGASEKLTAAVMKCTALYPIADALLDERDALAARVAALAKVVRAQWIKGEVAATGNLWCGYCGENWPRDKTEKHGEGCPIALAAPESAAPESAP